MVSKASLASRILMDLISIDKKTMELIQKLNGFIFLDISLPFVELTWEPDNKEFVYFLPSDYAASIKSVREEIRKRGIEDTRNKLVGPGTSTPSSAKEYIEAIGM